MKAEETKCCLKDAVKLPDLTGLAFEEDSHTYTLNGIVIPCVSDIMEPLSMVKYRGINEATLDAAAEKGTMVHNSIENWIKFEIEDVPPEHQGYFDGFLEWWNKYKPEVIGSEMRLFHKLMMYGGTVDLLSIIGGKLTLTDFKTTYTLSDMTCRVQLEAYAQALASHGIKVEQKQILHLVKDGKWDTREYAANDAECWRVFGSLKCVYDYVSRTK
ncbi:MAG: hypothetical protein IJD35_05445 [Clostridia bacterium]|nr:hypothetical protein [Clostridia bacterium]